jgi:hypothetical protein
MRYPQRTPEDRFLIIQKALLSASAGSNKDNVASPSRKRKRAEISSNDIEVLAAQVKLASLGLARVQQE